MAPQENSKQEIKSILIQEDSEANRKRKISFLPAKLNQTPPQLSVIKEEQTSNYQSEPLEEKPLQVVQSIKKQMSQMQGFETPGQFRTPKVKEEPKYEMETFSQNIDFELNQLKQQTDITLKKCESLSQNSEIDIKPIIDLYKENISNLRERLYELQQTEKKYEKSNESQPIKKKKEIQVEVIPQPTINNESIRSQLIKSLSYAVKRFFYKNKTFSILFRLKQADVLYQFQTDLILDPQMKLQDLFKCFQLELNQNKLTLIGLKVDFFRSCQIQKAELIKASLKQRFLNSKKLQKEIILATIHTMPLLLTKLDNLEQDLIYTEQVYGILWTHNLEFIYILVGQRFKVEERLLLNYNNSPLFRFQIDLKDFKLDYQYFQYYDELIQPFIKKDSKQILSMEEISFGERQHAKITDDYTEQIKTFLGTKPSLCDLVSWINILK